MSMPSAGGSYVRKPDGSLEISNPVNQELPKVAPSAPAESSEDTLLKSKGSAFKLSEEE